MVLSQSLFGYNGNVYIVNLKSLGIVWAKVRWTLSLLGIKYVLNQISISTKQKHLFIVIYRYGSAENNFVIGDEYGYRLRGCDKNL